MTVKDGIKIGIGLSVGKILVSILAGGVKCVYPKLCRKMKQVDPEFARCLNRIYPYEMPTTRDEIKSKAKIGFEI